MSHFTALVKIGYSERLPVICKFTKYGINMYTQLIIILELLATIEGWLGER